MKKQIQRSMTFEEKAKLIAAAYSRGIDEWIAVGRMICEVLDDDPDGHAAERLIFACSFLTEPMLRTFEAIGRGTIHPTLLAYSGPGVRRLRKMSISLQEKYGDPKACIDVLVMKYDPETETADNEEVRRVHVGEISELDARQVFAPDHIRTIDEQRDWISTSAVKRIPAHVLVTEPFRIVGSQFVALDTFKMDVREVEKAIKEWRDQL